MVFIREDRNDCEHRTIHSSTGKQTDKYKYWLDIINEKRQSIKSWKRDLTESDRLFVLRNNTNEKEIQEAKVKGFNSWKQNDIYEEVNYKNLKLISSRLVFRKR